MAACHGPYFERRLSGIDTFLAGQTLAKNLQQLDAVAAAETVTPLSSFGFADGLRGDTLQWYDPKLGSETTDAIARQMDNLEIPDAIRQPLLEDLQRWQEALERAASKNVRFCVLLRHGNSTSGHEWDVREGSAF